MNIPPLLRRALHWGGSALAVIGIVFVVFRLQSYSAQLNLSSVRPRVWGLVSEIAVVYGAANILLALAWWHLLESLGTRVVRLEAIKIYGVSQLARYLPGNVFHLAGRQALGMAAGISGVALVKSSIWELGLVAVAGSLYGWLILPLMVSGFRIGPSIFLLISSIVLVAALLARLVDFQVMWSFIYQIAFLAISGGAFFILLCTVNEGDGANIQCLFTIIAGSYVTAWLIGLVIPGAPAGVGVREMVLLLLLKSFVSEVDLLTAVLLGRLVTVFGDALFFIAAVSVSVKST